MVEEGAHLEELGLKMSEVVVEEEEAVVVLMNCSNLEAEVVVQAALTTVNSMLVEGEEALLAPH